MDKSKVPCFLCAQPLISLSAGSFLVQIDYADAYPDGKFP